MELRWGPEGVLGVFWAPFLPLRAFLGSPGGPLGDVQGSLGTIFLNLGAPRALLGGFSSIFQRFSTKN